MKIAIGLLLLCCVSLTVVTSADDVLSRVKRIVNGTLVAPPGGNCSWPFVAIVEKICVETGDVPLRCAGSIVAPDRVLTNKQCVTPNFPINIGCDDVRIRVIAGATVFYDVREDTRQIRWASHVVEHSQADIAMVTLEDPLELRENYVEVVQLSNVEQSLNDSVVAAGWGSTDIRELFDFSTSLQEVKLYLRHYDVGLLFYSSSVTDVFGEHSGVFNGDSGGPIVTYGGDPDVCQDPRLVAVINCYLPFGNCGPWRQARHPSVYYYRGWIQEQINYQHPPVENSSVVKTINIFFIVLLSASLFHILE